MTEEMVGGQHRNDESDTDLSVRGEHTNATIDAFFRSWRTGVPSGGQHPRKKLLQRPTSLEIACLPGAKSVLSLATQFSPKGGSQITLTGLESLSVSRKYKQWQCVTEGCDRCHCVFDHSTTGCSFRVTIPARPFPQEARCQIKVPLNRMAMP